MSHILTNRPGSSLYFKGGVVCYSAYAKEAWLGLSERFLKRIGTVGSQTSLLMAERVCQRLRADVGLGMTGYAGPVLAKVESRWTSEHGGKSRFERSSSHPGALKKFQGPVGLCFIALCIPRQKAQVHRFRFQGSRVQIKHACVREALRLLEEQLSP